LRLAGSNTDKFVCFLGQIEHYLTTEMMDKLISIGRYLCAFQLSSCQSFGRMFSCHVSKVHRKSANLTVVGLSQGDLRRKTRTKLLMNFQRSRFKKRSIGPSNKYIFRVGVGDILILLTV
jgi:hypothetical protein